MAKPPDLTPKQAAFVREYLVDLNATHAAIRAGYSAKTADVQGPRLLGHVGVKAAIAAGQTKLEKRTEITKDWVIAQATELLQLGIKEKQLGAARATLDLMARLHGYIIDRKEVRRIARWQDLTDEELATLASLDAEPDGKGTRH